jgi:hypothetical protein
VESIEYPTEARCSTLLLGLGIICEVVLILQLLSSRGQIVAIGGVARRISNALQHAMKRIAIWQGCGKIDSLNHFFGAMRMESKKAAGSTSGAGSFLRGFPVRRPDRFPYKPQGYPGRVIIMIIII